MIRRAARSAAVGRATTRRAAWAVVALWLVAVAVALPFALRQSDRLTAGGLDVGGAQSQRVEQRLRGIPADLGATVLVGVLVDHGGARQSDYARALADLDAAARAVPGVHLARPAREAALFFARERPGRPVVVPLTVGVDEFQAPDTAKALRERLRLGDGGGRYGAVTLHLAGQGALWAAMFDVTKQDLRDAELLGFPVILAVLLVAFGSVAAALLPLALGAVTIGITGALVYAISGELLMNFYATNMASMIGLGVAVDYSLFVVVRYREELRRGATADAARRTAMRTSGVAVMVSGCAVVLALAGLFLVDTAAVRSLALASIIVVLVAMLATATLLPALLRLAGGRLAGRARRRAERDGGRMARWAAAVLRRPGATLLAGGAILVALCLPALGMRIGDGALRQLPAGHEARAGFDAAARVSDPGRGAPVKVLVARRHVARTVALLRADPEVVRTGVRTQTRDTKQILIVATPRHDGDSA
jgi:RND superfamily putative drug exporter